MWLFLYGALSIIFFYYLGFFSFFLFFLVFWSVVDAHKDSDVIQFRKLSLVMYIHSSTYTSKGTIDEIRLSNGIMIIDSSNISRISTSIGSCNHSKTNFTQGMSLSYVARTTHYSTFKSLYIL